MELAPGFFEGGVQEKDTASLEGKTELSNRLHSCLLSSFIPPTSISKIPPSASFVPPSHGDAPSRVLLWKRSA